MTSARTPLRVLIVNDYPVVVAGVRAMLRPWAERVEIVGLRGRPDMMLYDTFGTSQGSALDVDRVLGLSSATKLVVYSWALDRSLVRDSLSAGAAGYLFKGLDGEQLVAALEAIHIGETVTSAGQVRSRPPAAADWPGRPQGLSVREAEVVALITQGMTNLDIAALSHLSINSVKTYIRTAYKKMGVTRRPQAVLWGVQHGFALERGARRRATATSD